MQPIFCYICGQDSDKREFIGHSSILGRWFTCGKCKLEYGDINEKEILENEYYHNWPN